MLELGEKFLKDKKVKDNSIAQSFYLKNGFKRYEDKDKDDELCLVKQLHHPLF